ncbi:ABC transporter permease [Blautia wexlerae]|uniref:ABC transporter permease n=1 Tax=Blautia wexlerae TaxID=418240 RepID=A0ABX2GNP4_9FIRM|nr:ABC transporter permease [Blautia wexlerae]NSF73882.1 ABC transporter permease [Blautia wexlerae]
MKNPLRKRLPRELKGELGKYLVVFILMVLTIGMVSGFLVADGSMIVAYNDGFEKYNIENGNFRTNQQIYKSQKEEIQNLGIKLYENFYIEEPLDNESTMRFFKNRTEINGVCLMKGELPKATGEIAIDRMYADNNDLKVGDTLKSQSGKQTWKITGLVALSDYSCLFQNNNDSMFDSVKFGVSVVTPEEFDTLDQDKLQYNYSWIYDKQPKTEKEEKDVSEELMENIGEIVTLEAFVPRYLNQAITFTGDDMGSDKAMMIILLYIVIVIMAFVFGITISNTIRRESGVIGTLRASGYTRRELIRHYMALPVLVTLVGALVGNILGYTVFKNVCAGMYYGSYSLPTYVTVWSAEAFLLTTVVPVIIMLVVNYGVLRHKLRLSPLKFLRRDLSGRKRKKAIYLSPVIKIFSRFRLRVIFQNMSNYLVLFIGIIFANLLLMFGLLLPSALSHYQVEIQNNMLAKYQYMLQIPASAVSGNKFDGLISLLEFYMDSRTDNEDAEEFSAYSLNTLPGKYKSEEVLLYGIEPDSRYVAIDFNDTKDTYESSENTTDTKDKIDEAGNKVKADNKNTANAEKESAAVYISSAYADKFLLHVGDTITLKEKYEKEKYSFKIAGVYDYTAALCVFMPRSELNDIFDLGEDYYSGYFSDTELTDIKSQYIGSVVDLDALTKISRQLDVSMGSMMGMVNGFAIVIYMVLIYLLSKIIIEKNAQSISMVKILGYTNGEISRLYILSTSMVVVLCLLLSLPLETVIMKVLFREMMLSSISGWITLWIDPMIYLQMFAAGIVTYTVVALLEFRRIKKVPMDEALKNVE